MRRALELAARADHRTSPNPMVGAVVLDPAGALAGEGFHARAGQAHAEVLALHAAGDRARGGTLYVNLEPCSHHARTPPCVEAVIAAGLRRVVVAMADPDERVRGRGIERLRAAGVDVEIGLAQTEAERLNEFYVKHRQTGLPFVTAKFAMSLDGKIATSAGDSRWISSEPARALSHRLRHAHDAVLVGVNTVLVDDPELSARLEGARQPLRVVVDSQLRTPPTARVQGPNTMIATTVTVTGTGEPGGAEIVQLDKGPGGVDLRQLLELLGKRGLISVLVEGGGEMHASLFRAGLVDKVVAFIAPLLIGGRGAATPIGGPGIASLTEGVALEGMEVVMVGPDLMISAYVHRDR